MGTRAERSGVRYQCRDECFVGGNQTRNYRFAVVGARVTAWLCPRDGIQHLPGSNRIPTDKKAPVNAGAKSNEVLSLAARHATTLAFVCIDRNQKSVAVGAGKFVSLYVGALIEGTVHFQAAMVRGSKKCYIPQYHALAICPRFTRQLHGGHSTTT